MNPVQGQVLEVGNEYTDSLGMTYEYQGEEKDAARFSIAMKKSLKSQVPQKYKIETSAKAKGTALVSLKDGMLLKLQVTFEGRRESGHGSSAMISKVLIQRKD
jgi:hypothetical protein